MRTRVALCLFCAVMFAAGAAWPGPANLRGSLGAHDPSPIVPCNGRYYIFTTGQGIPSKSSADKTYWVTGPSVFANPPSWTTNAVPGNTGNFWAPHVIFMNGQYYLYYSVSTFGKQVSAIGLATNPTLDPTSPSYHWTDQGPVIQSTTGSGYNCIDPSVAFDGSGNLWMSFGSFWNGIYMVRLDPATGLIYSVPTLTHLATCLVAGDPIEASYVYAHGGYYYLFVNWNTCCAGINSTYNIRVGRSTGITGPYLDQNGVDMVSGGGSLFLKTTGKYIGPGQMGVLDEGGTNVFTYHYYDANVNGNPTLDEEPLSWTSDGWPVFVNDWCARYRFQFDGRDDNGEYYGLLQNGAGILVDSELGPALNLNSTNQFVKLPIGVANARTFAAVFKWNGPATGYWQRVFDFGRGSSNGYAMLTTLAGAGGTLRFAMSPTDNLHEQTLNAPAAAPIGVWTHAAVTTDGSRGILYLNGDPVATNTSMTMTLADLVPTNVWFGRSQFSSDPYFNGQISSIRIYGRALSAAEIAAPQPIINAPASGATYQPGNAITFAGSASDFADNPLSVTGLTWTVEFLETGVTNVVWGPLSGVGDGMYQIPVTGDEATNGFHRIVLTAMDSLGRTATNTVDVFPGPTATNWTAFYPFDNGADDANGLFDGTLVNGASTMLDPIRGSVLNLSGASQDVVLPAGVGAMRTFAAWVKWGGGATAQRIFDFGQGTTSYAMLTTRANNTALRFEMTANGASEVRQLDAPTPLPTNVWTHVAVTLDGRQAVMFVNGRAVAVNASVNLLPSDVMGSANFLGHSQFASNPYYVGQMDSVQIASACMPIEQITASALSISGGLSGVTLSWPSWNNGLVLKSNGYPGNADAWTTIPNAPTPTNGVNFLSLPAAANQQWYRLQLP